MTDEQFRRIMLALGEVAALLPSDFTPEGGLRIGAVCGVLDAHIEPGETKTKLLDTGGGCRVGGVYVPPEFVGGMIRFKVTGSPRQEPVGLSKASGDPVVAFATPGRAIVLPDGLLAWRYIMLETSQPQPQTGITLFISLRS